MAAFCRDCLNDAGDAARCPACFSPRIVRHPELETLTIAHVDCDAFYATIEKRDEPALADKPLIIGGGKRGVVSTACYIARTFGVRSAMPMFEAKRLCPQATVVRPNMEKYAGVSRQVRALMLELTPQVEPISIDTSISMYPKLWAASGISYPDLIDRLIQLGLERFEEKKRNQYTKD